MLSRFILFIFFICLQSALFAQQSDYLLHAQVYYLMPSSQEYQFAGNYYGEFDQEPAGVVLDGMPLSRIPRKIRLQFSVYSQRGLSKPDEVIVNGQTISGSGGLVYYITNPSGWPVQKPLKMSLFSNWPPLDHWIDIPIIWDGQAPPPVESPAIVQPGQGADLVAKGGSGIRIGPGHAIQVATDNKVPDASTLELFKQFGSVYYLYEPPFYKIRLGPFASKQEALNKLVDVRQFQNGEYSDAFYLYESKNREVFQADAVVADMPQNYDMSAYTSMKGGGRIASTPTAIPQPFDRSRMPANRIYYESPGISIQLSTQVNRPDLTQYSYLEDLAPVYILNERNVYKLSIGPFPSKEAAQAVMPQILAAGFNYAFIRMP